MKVIDSFTRFLAGRDRAAVRPLLPPPLEEPLPGTREEDWLVARLGPIPPGFTPETIPSHARIAAGLALVPRRRELARALAEARQRLSGTTKKWVNYLIVGAVGVVETAVAERMFYTLGVERPWTDVFSAAHAATAIGLAAAVARKPSARPSYIAALVGYCGLIVAGAVLRTGAEVTTDESASSLEFWATALIFITLTIVPSLIAERALRSLDESRADRDEVKRLEAELAEVNARIRKAENDQRAIEDKAEADRVARARLAADSRSRWPNRLVGRTPTDTDISADDIDNKKEE